MKNISEKEIIELANTYLRQLPDYIEGVSITSVNQEDKHIVFRGTLFTDCYGVPTGKTKVALNLYESVSELFSKDYALL